MKKNKNLIYLVLLGAAAFAFLSMKKKKLKGRVVVDDLQKITQEEFETPPTNTRVESTPTNTQVESTPTNTPVQSIPDILIQEVKEAVESTPNPLDTIFKKAKTLINKKVKVKKAPKAILVKKLVPKTKMPKLVIPKLKPIKKAIKKAPKKRLKGFDDISVLY